MTTLSQILDRSIYYFGSAYSAFQGIFDTLTETYTIFGTDYTLLEIMIGFGLGAYIGFTVAKFLTDIIL